jgi:hypothetical protein
LATFEELVVVVCRGESLMDSNMVDSAESILCLLSVPVSGLETEVDEEALAKGNGVDEGGLSDAKIGSSSLRSIGE